MKEILAQSTPLLSRLICSLDADTSCLDLGEVKPPVDSVHNFEDALNAYDRIKSGRATGKVVVKVDPTVD